MLRHKIGQMLLVGFQGAEVTPDSAIAKAITEQSVGGVILFDYDYQKKTYEHNIRNPEQLKQLTAQLQSFNSNASIPLFIGVDYEGGKVNRLKENKGFPKTISAEAMALLPESEAEQYASNMANALKNAGVNLNFAPDVDLNVNPANPVIGKLGRSFSSDASIVAKYASLFADAHAKRGIMSVFKHFPGHGSSTSDSHLGFVDVTSTWQKEELEPYQQLLKDQTNTHSMVMTAHVVHQGLDPAGYPASLSKAMTTGLLRQKLHFNSVVVTDDLQMKAITDNYSLKEAVRFAVNAGADILVFGNQLTPTHQDPSEIVNMIHEDVLSGEIPESRIDESYGRIVSLKSFIR